MVRKTIVVLGTGLLMVVPSWFASMSAAAQQRACLHGAGEAQVDRDRRLGALRLARAINTAQVQAQTAAGSYAPLGELQGLTGAPGGFAVQLAVDEGGYVFNVKDTLDPCRFAYFSDQLGVIYAGEPIR